MRRPERSADYLNIISRAVFSAGLSWAVIDAKWDAFEEAFRGFDPVAVAALTDPELEVLAEDSRLVRSRSKIRATVDNAAAILAIEREHGSMRAWLDGFGSYGEATAAVHRRFKYLSKTFGAYYFLYISGTAIPDFPTFEAWSEATGEAHPRMRELVEANEGRPVGGPRTKKERPEAAKRKRAR
jgi:3-methyladenine DNA glycosylase Tag